MHVHDQIKGLLSGISYRFIMLLVAIITCFVGLFGLIINFPSCSERNNIIDVKNSGIGIGVNPAQMGNRRVEDDGAASSLSKRKLSIMVSGNSSDFNELLRQSLVSILLEKGMMIIPCPADLAIADKAIEQAFNGGNQWWKDHYTDEKCDYLLLGKANVSSFSNPELEGMITAKLFGYFKLVSSHKGNQIGSAHIKSTGVGFDILEALENLSNKSGPTIVKSLFEEMH